MVLHRLSVSRDDIDASPIVVLKSGNSLIAGNINARYLENAIPRTAILAEKFTLSDAHPLINATSGE
jgi:hypothetical protein